MKPIAILSNKTRAEQRPPLFIGRVDADLLARFGFKKTRPVPKPVSSGKMARGKQKPGKAPPPSAAVKRSPVTRGPSAAPQAQAQPEPKLPPVAKPQPAKQAPQTEQPARPAWQSKPAPPSDQRQKPAVTRPHQLRKFQNNPPSRSLSRPLPRPLPGEESHFSGRSSAASNGSTARDGQEANTPPAPKIPPIPSRPAGQQPPQRPVENDPPANKPSGMNGVPANGKGQVPPRPSNGNRAARPLGANGSDSSAPRSTVFRSGSLASIPVLRIPPKANGTAQKPPTQIPMEVYSRPNGEPGAPPESSLPENGKPAVPRVPPPQPSPASKAPSLDQVFLQNPGLPAQAAVLGVCADGLPVLMDLSDPAPGALVVIGDEREEQLQILRTAVSSIAGRGSPRDVQILILSCEPDTWQAWVKEQGFDRHLLAVESAEADTVRDWIVRLADWTEQRRLGQSSGPSVLLVMDTLSFLPTLSYDIRLNFEWMAKEGPQARIWPLAVISTDLAKSLSSRRMLRAFQTRVMGYANQPDDYVSLAGLEPQAAEAFGRRGEFTVKIGDSWLRFRLPGR